MRFGARAETGAEDGVEVVHELWGLELFDVITMTS